jgi:mRNA interferase MazF
MNVAPGDVLIVNFPGITGTKRRPVVVVSSPEYHAARPDVIVGLLTSRTAAAVASTDYALRDWAQAGLRIPTAFRTFLATLPATGEPLVVGRLSVRDWAAVRARLRIALAPLDQSV